MNKTKIIILENVCTGNIQKLECELLSETGDLDVRVIHGCTEDSGYGGHRRYRGWTLVETLPVVAFRMETLKKQQDLFTLSPIIMEVENGYI